jgi:hypothetical protein
MVAPVELGAKRSSGYGCWCGQGTKRRISPTTSLARQKCQPGLIRFPERRGRLNKVIDNFLEAFGTEPMRVSVCPQSQMAPRDAGCHYAPRRAARLCVVDHIAALRALR